MRRVTRKKAAIISAVVSGTLVAAAITLRALVMRAYRREMQTRGIWRYNDEEV